ncbi:hypothetical protein ILUMI_12273 [Ignelater luminosus]|uniref:Uncharacterized protein n=1 Tax=Ignelater luminosus TaxID=2038154 RepID=A0A8K0G9Q2_IGNLU|nr:hypothetical protein ILUMI_12273 [Ignelater luminosus]
MKISIALIFVIHAAFATNAVTGFSLISNVIESLLDLIIIGKPNQPPPKPQNRTTMSYIRKQWIGPVAPYISECMCKTHVKPKILNNFYEKGKLSNDPGFKCQIKCYAIKLHFMSSTGEIDFERWSELFPYLDLKLAQKCSKIVEPLLCEKAYLCLKCVYESLSKQYPP